MTHKRKIWTFSDHELLILTLALQAGLSSREKRRNLVTDRQRIQDALHERSRLMMRCTFGEHNNQSASSQ